MIDAGAIVASLAGAARDEGIQAGVSDDGILTVPSLDDAVALVQLAKQDGWLLEGDAVLRCYDGERNFAVPVIVRRL